MAKHIVRDSKGRIDKILNDKEFEEYNSKRGCFKYIVMAILILGGVGFFKECVKSSSSDNSSEIPQNTTSVPLSSSSQVTTTASSNAPNKGSGNTDTNTGITSEVPASDTEMRKGCSIPQTSVSTNTDIIMEEAAVNSEDQAGQELSRKEKRALEKAQRKAEKEQRREQKALEKTQKKAEKVTSDDLYGY